MCALIPTRSRLEAAEAEVTAARAALAHATENYDRDNAAWLQSPRDTSAESMLLLRAATRSGIAKNIASLDVERAELAERIARLHLQLQEI